MASDGRPVFKEERSLGGHKSDAYGVAISPDGTLVASAGSDDKLFLLVEIAPGRRLYTFTHTKSLRGVAWAANETRLWVSAGDGSIFEVSRSKDGGNWSHKTVYKHTTWVCLLSYAPAINLLALPCWDRALVLVDVAAGYKAIQTLPLGAEAWRVVCNASGSLLFVGCKDGLLCAFARNGNGVYDKVGEVKAHEKTLRGLSLSVSGSLLLVTSDDGTASLWRVASPFSSFDTARLMTFKGHGGAVYGAAFRGDEQFALTCSNDQTIRMWRIADGAQVGSISCKDDVLGLSFHAASGALAVTTYQQGVDILRCDPQASLAAATSIDRRARKPLAARELSTIQRRIATFDASVRAVVDKERSLEKDILGLKSRLAIAENELAFLRTADYLKKRGELAKLLEQEDALKNEISVYDHVLHELDENTKMPNCLGYLHGDGFEQWLHDIGLAHAVVSLKDVGGDVLATLLASDLEGYGLSFADSCSLLLRGYITHHQLSAAPHFVLSTGLLSWDAKATSTWLTSQGSEYAALSSLGWNGACLCSLSAQRVRGTLSVAAFNGLRRMVHDQLVSEGAPEWALRWSATSMIDHLHS